LRTIRKIAIAVSLLFLGCEPIVEESGTLKYGTFFTLKNNTFGVNDFHISDSGYFAISFGAIDWGRNIYRNHQNQIDYSDSIGYIYFNGVGSGHLRFVNQDTIPHYIPFYYEWGEKDRNYQYLNIRFEKLPMRTWSRTEPLYTFGYQKIGKYWRYQNSSDTYSGPWKWTGNKLLYNGREG
jgi:hypothetical protein